MNMVLSTLLAYPNYVSLGALIMSVFFAGTILQGERVRQREIRDELRSIQQLTEQSLARVEEISTVLKEEDARLMAEIKTTYQELAALTEKERVQRLALEQSARRNQQLNSRRQENRQEVQNSQGFIIDN